MEDGSSISDFDEEEHQRKFSIDTHLLNATYKGKQIHLLDTPVRQELQSITDPDVRASLTVAGRGQRDSRSTTHRAWLEKTR